MCHRDLIWLLIQSEARPKAERSEFLSQELQKKYELKNVSLSEISSSTYPIELEIVQTIAHPLTMGPKKILDSGLLFVKK